MEMDEGWTPLTVPEMDELPRPVFLRAETLAARCFFPEHVHRWHQFAYAMTGALVTTTETARYVVGPEQAIWIPAHTPHRSGAPFGAEFRSLYVAPEAELDMPESCAALAMTPLLRALIVELDAAVRAGEAADYIGGLDGLILAQLRRLPRMDFSLPWPSSRALRALCEGLYADAGDSRTLVDWGKALGASPRTLNRRFESELGVTFRDWRQQLRLFRAVEQLAAGRSVTDVAFDLGYASPSAFTYMFRRKTGRVPSAGRRAPPEGRTPGAARSGGPEAGA